MNYLAVSKFDSFQHYKNRKPSWVKFYVSLLDPKHPLNQLPVPTRYLFDRLLLLAAEWSNAIPNDSELIAKLVGMETGECREGLEQLKKGRWIKEKQTKRRASKPASKPASKSAPPERELEREKEPPQPPLNGGARKLTRREQDRYTGCRYVYNGRAPAYVHDPLGTDAAPPGWPHQKPTPDEIRVALLEHAHA